MKISVSYDDTDVANVLRRIISDPNAEEFVKLLTPMICQNSPGVDLLFKLMIGATLPKVIPDGTICRLSVNDLGYNSNKDAIRKKFADKDDKIVVRVKQFRGYHEYTNYVVEYQNINSKNVVETDTTYVSLNRLEVIEEF